MDPPTPIVSWRTLACEMNRGAYRSEDASERYNDLAAGKESGAIEYAAKAQIVLRSVKGRDDLVQVRVPKIKRGTKDETEFFLSFDRVKHSLEECDAPEEPREAANEEDRDVAKNVRRVKADAKTLSDVVLANAGIGERELRGQASRDRQRLGPRTPRRREELPRQASREPRRACS
jgi:hypothetical protein